MGTALIALAVIAAVFGLAVFQRRQRILELAERPHFDIKGSGDFDTEVVGESHYQDALRRCVNGTGYVREEFTARLVCESDNAHDRNAVRVEIIGSLVGYLPRASAAAYRRILADNHLRNATGIARAIICGGGDKKFYGVWIDM